MGNDKENFTQKVIEAMDKDETATKNKALKKVIQETHDKEYNEVMKYIKGNEYKKDITFTTNLENNNLFTICYEFWH